jgi:multicomponent K+:H+ antiporter subunit A
MMMSLSAMAGGLALYLVLRFRLKAGRFPLPPLIHRLDGRRLYVWAMIGLGWLGRRGLRVFGTERLQVQMLCLLGLGFAAAAAPFMISELSAGSRPMLPVSAGFVVLWSIGMACAVGAAYQAKYHRLAALILAGGAGLVTCLTFVWFSAPDLALTQVTVEIVTTVLLLLGLRWLPKRIELENDPRRRSMRARARRARDFVLAMLAGTGMAALVFAILTREFPQSISPFFLSRALPEGGGANVVNVMLVDFRGFDTLGEVTVLSAVALAVYALLRRFRPSGESIEQPRQQRGFPEDSVTDLVNPRAAADTAVGYLLVPAVLVRLLLPLSWVVAMYLLLRGHNQPGGGFIAGLVVSIGFILQYMVAGTLWVEANMKLRPPRWIAVGLLLAVTTGLGAVALGYPFLTSHTAHRGLPVFGEVHVPSAMFVDLGIFSVVVGATMLILTALAHQSLRSRRPARAQPASRASGPDDPDPRSLVDLEDAASWRQ